MVLLRILFEYIIVLTCVDVDQFTFCLFFMNEYCSFYFYTPKKIKNVSLNYSLVLYYHVFFEQFNLLRRHFFLNSSGFSINRRMAKKIKTMWSTVDRKTCSELIKMYNVTFSFILNTLWLNNLFSHVSVILYWICSFFLFCDIFYQTYSAFSRKFPKSCMVGSWI